MPHVIPAQQSDLLLDRHLPKDIGRVDNGVHHGVWGVGGKGSRGKGYLLSRLMNDARSSTVYIRLSQMTRGASQAVELGGWKQSRARGIERMQGYHKYQLDIVHKGRPIDPGRLVHLHGQLVLPTCNGH